MQQVMQLPGVFEEAHRSFLHLEEVRQQLEPWKEEYEEARRIADQYDALEKDGRHEQASTLLREMLEGASGFIADRARTKLLLRTQEFSSQIWKMKSDGTFFTEETVLQRLKEICEELVLLDKKDKATSHLTPKNIVEFADKRLTIIRNPRMHTPVTRFLAAGEQESGQEFDIRCLGALLYESCSKIPPTTDQLKASSLPELSGRYSLALNELIQKMTSAEVDQTIPTAKQVLDSLQELKAPHVGHPLAEFGKTYRKTQPLGEGGFGEVWQV